MPEPAGTRSLEDILASIRKSLSDETVDGLVQLSAAAAAAVRAEANPTQRSIDGKTDPAATVTVADALADDLLRDKLAGALSTEEAAETPPDDLSELLAEPSVSLAHPAPAEAPAEAAGESALAKLWFIRPGKPEEAQSPGTSSLEIDPFAETGARPPSNGQDATTIFSRSASQLLRDGAEVAQDAPTVANVLKAAAPRLDREKIELLNKLRASNAAAIEKIAKENAEAEAAPATPEPETSVAEAAAPSAEPLDTPPAKPSEPEAEEGVPDVAQGEGEGAATPDGEQALRALLTLPERSTPLFGAMPDGRRPIVTSAAAHLIPDSEDEPPVPSSTEVQGEAKPVAEMPGPGRADMTDAPLEPLPVPVAEGASQDEASGAPVEIAAVASQAQSEAMPVPASAGERSLEDMIAAVLEPVLHRLIEKNLEPLVEVLVRREVEKALKASRE